MKVIPMRAIFLLYVTLLINSFVICHAQAGVNGGQNLQGMNGAVLTPDKVSEMVGTYFYKTDYQQATLVDVGGKEYRDMKVKLNQKNNLIYYLGKDGQEMEAISDIRKIVFLEGDKPVVFENFFPAIAPFNAGTFYQVLISGKAKLLSATLFSEAEYKEFGSAVTTKRADKVVQLYAFANGTIIKLTKGEAELLDLLKDKSTELSAYIKQQGLKCKKQSDYETVFTYYNSLK